MASFNRVILVGNITRDIDLKYLQSGTAVTELGLAVNDRRKNQQGEWIDETTFVDITLWGRQAEIASEYLGKGSPVLIEGRLKLDTWETDGQKRSKLRVVGEKMQMLSGRSGGGGGPQGGGGGSSHSNSEQNNSEQSSNEQSSNEQSSNEQSNNEQSNNDQNFAELSSSGGHPPSDDIPF
jgi:single-strand DNA-binding protein